MDMNKVNKILEFSCDILKEKLSGIAMGSALEVLERDRDFDTLVINCRSEVLLYGPDLTLRMQLFYNMEKMKEALFEMYKNSDDNTVTDHFNEVCNVCTGEIGQALTTRGLTVGVSLPISESSDLGTLERFEALPIQEQYVLKCTDSDLIYAKLSLDLHNTKAMDSFDSDSLVRSSEESDVEFF